MLLLFSILVLVYFIRYTTKTRKNIILVCIYYSIFQFVVVFVYLHLIIIYNLIYIIYIIRYSFFCFLFLCLVVVFRSAFLPYISLSSNNHGFHIYILDLCCTELLERAIPPWVNINTII